MKGNRLKRCIKLELFPETLCGGSGFLRETKKPEQGGSGFVMGKLLRLKVFVNREFSGIPFFGSGHNTGFLVFTHALLEEVGFTL